MIKSLHLIFVLIVIALFVGKVVLSVIKPELLKQKIFTIAPHAISGLLILTGIILVFQGNWLSGDFGWIIAKVIALVGFVGLGVLTMRSVGTNRWLAFSGAIGLFVYIGIVAVSKNPWFFL
jgi:uncharacterized membrane protein SirB2